MSDRKSSPCGARSEAGESVAATGDTAAFGWSVGSTRGSLGPLMNRPSMTLFPFEIPTAKLSVNHAWHKRQPHDAT
ncbi:hypothetical protein BQ8794_140223 [Mesorhizobium prunaredense]|uniref:Uncharacterized protein n=1 Tax=Mesorhizobium prunaredense TaxID=1631249 RepID=A0A1R3V4D2_9HYPH|nr:hypothetical protein BQ8794_140223 [Mesorhizobium prunaredense]